MYKNGEIVDVNLTKMTSKQPSTDGVMIQVTFEIPIEFFVLPHLLIKVPKEAAKGGVLDIVASLTKIKDDLADGKP